MKFKLFIIGTLAFMSMLYISCDDDVLDQVNPNEISTLSFWRNADDARVAVNGMYHSFTGTFHWGRIAHVGALLRTDAMNIIPNGSNTAMSTLQGEPGVSRWSVEPYQECYKSIFRANAILENVDEENISDASIRNGILGQAYFFRAFTYFYLVNTYGNVPLVIATPDPTNNDDLFPSQEPTGTAGIWEQIIADFQQAENLLPDAWTGSDIGRPTSFSAAAFRGKSLIYRSGLLGTNDYADSR